MLVGDWLAKHIRPSLKPLTSVRDEMDLHEVREPGTCGPGWMSIVCLARVHAVTAALGTQPVLGLIELPHITAFDCPFFFFF